MKKTLVLASLLAAFGAASAQTSVTVGGVTSFGYQRDKAAPSLTETDMAVVFKGTEQLGGGLSAAFSLELDNGSSVSQFRSAVTRKNTSLSLTGGFGVVTLANTRGSELAAMAFVAPTNLSTGTYDATVLSRAPIDMLGYSLPMGPLTLGASYTESGAGVGNPANNLNTATLPVTLAAVNTNKTVTLSARYTAGPLAIAAAYKNTDSSVLVLARSSNYELGATYDLGVAKIGLGFDSKPVYAVRDTTPAVNNTAFTNDASAVSVGVSVPMGQTSFGVNYAKRGDANQLEAGLQHNLSARTNVNLSLGRYAAYDSKTDTFAPKVSQYRVSLNHAF